ncbi:peptidoglycan DD-metalloendopeptidase family protein [Flavobacterium sp. HNIBRBA15423]|uniref:peptidoglycan DD-metalloendopeptidase family protein n=1 Tax=Flavobacterium sp. HNIBRBA15423 TaxID=3458683 RepID=UPI0040446C34
MKRGVKRIIGKTEIAVNVWETYSVAEWYSDTPIQERNASQVKWAVYYLGGAQPEKILEKTEGVFRFQEPAVGKSYLIVAYVYEPELSTGLQVTVTSATEKKITTIRATGKSDTLSYGDTLDVVVQTSGMQNDYLELSLYEDDAAGSGHNSINNKNLLKTQTVRVGSQGVATTQFLLEPNFQRIANAYLARGNNSEGSTHEFYVAAYYLGSLKDASNNINVANPQNSQLRREETTQVINGKQPQATGKVNNVQLTRNGAKKLLVTVNSTGLVGKTIRLKVKEEDYLSNDLLVDKNFVIKSDAYRIDIFLDRIPQNAGGGYWSEGNYQELFADVEVVETESHILSETIDVDISAFKVEIADNRTETVINDEESLLAAYFAKKEYVEKTNEEAGTDEYTFGGTKANNKTSTLAEKEAIADIILSKVTDKLKLEKKYTTKDAIVEALTAEEYGTDTESNKTVAFKTFKLGPKFIRINSAPLEEKVYLVAETGSLNGKTVTIKIKEKDGIIKGTADAMLPVLEITEQQMEATTTSEEVQGTEKTQFTATVTNGIAKVPIHLRPKSDEDLEKWKEKITKGKEDGNYTYTFGNDNGTIITAENKTRIAGIIIDNAKGGKLGNPKIEDGKTAYKEDVETVLEVKTYNKGDTITFPTYKKGIEMLWLDVLCSGDKREHHKEFLKEEGAYFVIGKKCPRCREKITIEQIEELFGVYTSHSAFRQEIVDNLNKYIFESGREIHINTCLRKAHFLAQVGAETLGINPDWMVETDKYRYSKSRCLDIFGNRAATLNNMGLLESYCNENPQEKLLNYMYAAENGFGNGNGNEASGDGYLFRGRGLKQLTGKGNYKSASEYLNEFFPSEYINLEANPDKVKEAKYAVLSAIAYWEKHKIWETADTLKISNNENIKKIRRLVNPGLAGWSDAKSYYDKAINVFKVNSCTPTNAGSSDWIDPIDNPQRTYYNSNGVHKEQNGAFGPVRTKIVNGVSVPKNHQGLDIFADVDTECRACLDGTIVSYMNEGNNGYGNVLVLEVNGEDLRNAKREYSLEFTEEVESGTGFDINAEKFYLRYAHLNSAIKTSGEVKAGEVICYSGDTGNASGVPNPHLHFEVAMNATSNGTGLTNRYNPAYFVRLTAINQQKQEEVKNSRS